MFKNYIILAWRVLTRRKFFTFITLFGISFTLLILMLVTSFVQTEFGGTAPLGNQNELVVLPVIELSIKHYDTIPTVDTTYSDMVAKFDTTYDIKSIGSSSSSSSMSDKMLEKYFRDIASVKRSTIFNTSSAFDIYMDNSKINIKVNYSDHFFWDVFDFKFIHGRPYDASEVEQGLQVAVITLEMAQKYFGKTNVLDELIGLDGKQFKIIGIVERSKVSTNMLKSDLYIPYPNYSTAYVDPYFGGYTMVFQSDEDLQKVKAGIEETTKKVPSNLNPNYNTISSNPATYAEIYARTIYYQADERKSLSFMRGILLGLLSFFILLPVLNLINLNVSRIMDRSSEIGVRKAFGATKGDILTQFIFENVIQTLLGGLIGFVLVLIAIYIINNGGYLGGMELEINFKFFLYSILICLLFGVLSGLLPAWKMSKTHIVNALKSKQL